MRSRSMAFALFFVTLGSSSALAQDVYQCSIKQNARNGNWLPEVVVVSVDTQNKRALAFDPVIKRFNGDAIEARITVENAKRITFSWELSDTDDVIGQDARMVYRLTILKGTKAASMTGQALGYVGPYTSQGTCEFASN
jgi:hypothetical protein